MHPRDTRDFACEADFNLIRVCLDFQVGIGAQLFEHGGLLLLDSSLLVSEFFALFSRCVGDAFRRLLGFDALLLAAAQILCNLQVQLAAGGWLQRGKQSACPVFQCAQFMCHGFLLESVSAHSASRMLPL